MAVHPIERAKPLATRLKSRHHGEIEDRIIESYAVPAAIASVLFDEEDDKANEVLGDMLCGVEKEISSQSDEKNLLAEILASHVRLSGSQQLTVSQIISSESEYHTHRETLEGYGIGLLMCRNRRGPRRSDAEYDVDSQVLFIAYRQVAKLLLARTDWEGQNLAQILRRVPGAKANSRRQLAKSRQPGVEIPMTYVMENYLDEDDNHSQQSFA